MSQNDKTYYLKDLELALLLSIKGMKELYGIKMEHIKNPPKTLIYQTLFELEKKELISGNKGKVVIDKRLNQLLDSISNAEKILYYTNRLLKYPDQCIYLSDRAVAVSVYGTVGDMKRIESVSLSRLPEKLCEYGFQMEEVISDRSLFEEIEIENPKLAALAEMLFSRAPAIINENEWGTITNCMKLFSVKNGCKKQYLIAKEGFNDYFIVTDEKMSFIRPYSKKTVIDTLKNDLQIIR